MTWFGDTTALAGGVSTAVAQFDTSDAINDILIVLTDGFEGNINIIMFIKYVFF